MCESWNGRIVKAREKPIIYMFEMIRRYLMKRFQKNRDFMESYERVLYPKVQDEMNLKKLKAKKCHVQPATNQLFEVDSDVMNQAVDLAARRARVRNER